MNVLFLSLLSFLGAPFEVEVVSNDKTAGAMTLVFEEDLRFGGEEEEDVYLWADGQAPANFTVSPDGRIFVMDLKNSQILEFDSKGLFTKVFAKRGEGPGEYQGLGHFQIFDDGSAIGFDQLQGTTKFSYYDSNLVFQKTEVKSGFDEIIARPTFARNGKFFFAWYMNYNTDTNTMLFKTGIFNEKLALVKELSSLKWPIPDQTRIGDSNMWVDYLADQFKLLLNRGTSVAAFTSDHSILVADGKNYEIQVWDPTYENHLKTITKEFDPIAYTESDKESLVSNIEDVIFAQGGNQLSGIITKNVIQKAVAKAEVPPYRNGLLDVIPMEKGQFMALRDWSFETGSFKGEIFDASGKFIGTATSPGGGVSSLFGTRALFRNGFFYAMEKSEEGDNQMVRYRYTLKKN